MIPYPILRRTKEAIDKLKNPLRNCEKCGGSYSTGKEYGDFWCQLTCPDVETKGLCEYCNL